MITTHLRDVIAERMRVEHRALAARWFSRLLVLVPVDKQGVFPTHSLLDHIPELILEISAFLRHPEESAISANTSILDKATELGALRHTQRASLHQVLREYQLLHGVLVTFVVDEVQQHRDDASAVEAIAVVSRIHQAVQVFQQATVEAFVALYTRTIEAQNARLEQFTRMAAHEWRQPLEALQFAVVLLRTGTLDVDRTHRTIESAQRSIQHLVELTQRLEGVARMHGESDTLVVQEVSLTTVVREAARQLREMADARGVHVRVSDDLPTLTVDVGRLELVFMNLLSNAIKYADPAKSARVVEVTAAATDNGRCRIEVTDNGIGIPANTLPTIFQRFTRGHVDHQDVAHVAGVGLGLSIVEECLRELDGQVEVRSVEGEGTTFVVALPLAPPR